MKEVFTIIVSVVLQIFLSDTVRYEIQAWSISWFVIQSVAENIA